MLSFSCSTQQFSPQANCSKLASLECRRQQQSEEMLTMRKRCMMTPDHPSSSPTLLGHGCPDAVPEGDGVRIRAQVPAEAEAEHPRTVHCGPKLCRRGTFGGAASVAGTIHLVQQTNSSADAVDTAPVRHPRQCVCMDNPTTYTAIAPSRHEPRPVQVHLESDA
jgi:hypothetical protein